MGKGDGKNRINQKEETLNKEFGYPRGYTYIYIRKLIVMINELLEKRDILGDIAVELYGDFWITEEAFWGSTTEQQMLQVTEQLNNLGWVDQLTDEEIEMADKIMELLKKEGKFEDPSE